MSYLMWHCLEDYATKTGNVYDRAREQLATANVFAAEGGDVCRDIQSLLSLICVVSLAAAAAAP